MRKYSHPLKCSLVFCMRISPTITLHIEHRWFHAIIFILLVQDANQKVLRRYSRNRCIAIAIDFLCISLLPKQYVYACCRPNSSTIPDSYGLLFILVIVAHVAYFKRVIKERKNEYREHFFYYEVWSSRYLSKGIMFILPSSDRSSNCASLHGLH